MFRRLRKLFFLCGLCQRGPLCRWFRPKVDCIERYRVWGRPAAGDLPFCWEQCLSDRSLRVPKREHLLHGGRTYRKCARVRRPPANHQVAACVPCAKGHYAALVRIAEHNGSALRGFSPTRGRLRTRTYSPACVLQRVCQMWFCVVCLLLFCLGAYCMKLVWVYSKYCPFKYGQLDFKKVMFARNYFHIIKNLVFQRSNSKIRDRVNLFIGELLKINYTFIQVLIFNLYLVDHFTWSWILTTESSTIAC